MSGEKENIMGRYARDMVVSMLTALVSFTGYYFTFTNDQGEQLDALRKELFAQQAQITDLKIQLSKKYESSDILRNFLDGMPYPAWVKILEEGTGTEMFVMWHINRSYENYFDVSNLLYRNKTDFEIWPEHIAAEFYANDLATLKKMNHRCSAEKFPAKASEPNGKTINGFVCKWTTSVNGKIAIAGQILLDR